MEHHDTAPGTPETTSRPGTTRRRVCAILGLLALVVGSLWLGQAWFDLVVQVEDGTADATVAGYDGLFFLWLWMVTMGLVGALGTIAIRPRWDAAPLERRIDFWWAGCCLAWIEFFFIVPTNLLGYAANVGAEPKFLPIALLIVCVDGPLIMLGWSL